MFLCQVSLLLIQTLPLQAGEISPVGEKGQGGRNIEVKNEAVGVKGVASYYAKRYNGRKTQSGERYKPEKLSAAHPTFPMGTRIKIVNLDNQKEVLVRINDRCRKRKVPNVDLSKVE